MTEHGETILPFEVAQSRLGVTRAVFEGLVYGGLLGFHPATGIPSLGVDHYERYGTQWRPELGARGFGKESYQDLPEIPEGAQPPSTFYRGRIARTGRLDLRTNDVGWLAHFYLKPNPFFFPFPLDLSLIGPVPIRLSKPWHADAAPLPTRLYPAPDQSLALVAVEGFELGTADAWAKAHTVATSLLDQLTLLTDVPLLVCQSIVLYVPSGVIEITYRRPPAPIELAADMPLDLTSLSQLKETLALYREGVSASSPFQQFLTLWTAYESACSIRGKWRKQTKRSSVQIEPEVFPDVFAFKKYVGLTFDQAKQELNKSYRVAIAHGDPQGRAPRTSSSARDYFEVSTRVPVVRHMAKVTIRNVRETLMQRS